MPVQCDRKRQIFGGPVVQQFAFAAQNAINQIEPVQSFFFNTISSLRLHIYFSQRTGITIADHFFVAFPSVRPFFHHRKIVVHDHISSGNTDSLPAERWRIFIGDL